MRMREAIVQGRRDIDAWCGPGRCGCGSGPRALSSRRGASYIRDMSRTTGNDVPPDALDVLDEDADEAVEALDTAPRSISTSTPKPGSCGPGPR